MSPCADRVEPLCASTPLVTALPTTNGYLGADNRHVVESLNGHVNANIVSESTNSMDVLSGGESDAGDTLSRRNNNSVSSCITTDTWRDVATGEGGEVSKKRGAHLTYLIAKELLMTERTYKRDLELITVGWSRHVSRLAEEDADARSALARVCLALEPLALPAGAFLAKLERTLAAPSPSNDENGTEEPEYKKIAELLNEYMSSTYDAYALYIERAPALVGLVESVRRQSGAAGGECGRFDCSAPLPLACLLLRPLHRLLHLERRATDLSNVSTASISPIVPSLAQAAREQLRHVENHAALCQLQRDIAGYDKLLVAEREFIRLGCVYKHSTRGLQQRMLFLFSDLLIVASKPGGSQFRAHAALELRTVHVTPAELPHSFTITGEEVNLLLSASNEQEYTGWSAALQTAIQSAKEQNLHVDTELTPYEINTGAVGGCGASGAGGASGASGASGAGGALTHVCWHRVTSLDRHRLHLAARTQLSGYLLRKFKNSHGWQKLWVVFAMFTLFFYKSWQDESPLASLPLLGYKVGAPSVSDAIHKEFVFKLQFKNHEYFFRADSQYTYNSFPADPNPKNKWISAVKLERQEFRLDAFEICRMDGNPPDGDGALISQLI